MSDTMIKYGLSGPLSARNGILDTPQQCFLMRRDIRCRVPCFSALSILFDFRKSLLRQPRFCRQLATVPILISSYQRLLSPPGADATLYDLSNRLRAA